jgi:hypothetical protein
MNLPQAIVVATGATSSKRTRVVANSPGIDEKVLAVLPRWSPFRSAMMAGHKTAVFYTPINDRQSIVGRSYAGAYDKKGDRPLVSSIVVVQNAQLKTFHNNAVLLLNALVSSGCLILDTNPPKVLPAIEMPSAAVNYFTAGRSSIDAQRVLSALELHNRIALMDVAKPLDSLGRLLNQIPLETRSRLSFSIGRRITDSAPFDISFYPNGDESFDQELAQREIFPVQCGVRKKLDREMV